MRMPGFTVHATLYQTNLHYPVLCAGHSAIINSVKMARFPSNPNVIPLGEPVVACGACRCYRYGRGIFADVRCSRTCCYPVGGICESFTLPCGPK